MAAPAPPPSLLGSPAPWVLHAGLPGGLAWVTDRSGTGRGALSLSQG